MVELTEMDRVKSILDAMDEYGLSFDIDDTKKELYIEHRDHPLIKIRYTEITVEKS